VGRRRICRTAGAAATGDFSGSNPRAKSTFLGVEAESLALRGGQGSGDLIGLVLDLGADD
jgi:hypothetical protein